MRQLFLDKGLLKIKEVSKPLLDDYFVLVETRYSFVPSGGELLRLLSSYNKGFFCHAHDKIRKLVDLILQQGGTYARNVLNDHFKGHITSTGNSCSGRVLAVGKKVKKVSVGDYVACAGHSFANHAEVVCVPEQLLVGISHKKHLKAAAITGIGAIAMNGIRRAHISLGETVCVFGAHSLGIITAKLAELSGARVIILDDSRERLQYASDNGILLAFHVKDSEVQSALDHVTQSYGVDCSIICPDFSDDRAVNIAIDVTRRCGRIVLVGERSIILQHERVQHKEIDIIFSLAYGPGRYDVGYELQGKDYPYAYVRWTETRNIQAFVDLIEMGNLSLDFLIKREISFDDVSSDKLAQFQDESEGTLISYCQFEHCSEKKSLKKENVFIPARKEKETDLMISFFGATRATRLSVLPVINSIKGVKIHKIIDRDISYALNAAKMYKGAVALAGDPELFSEDSTTDVIYIASNHLLHSEHIVKSLQGGKAVYLQKPFLMTEEELIRLQSCIEGGFGKFAVGFYRSQSPFIQKIKKFTDKRANPLMISYRLNLGALDDQETLDKRPLYGNVFDKASHIFDLFGYLTNSKPISISVETLKSQNEHLFSGDNFIAQVSMEDGSLCCLHMTSLGNLSNGVERMEIHFDNKSIVMEDFIRLMGYGLPKSFDELVRIPDRGREITLNNFLNSLKTSQVYDKGFYAAMNMALSVDRLISDKGGETLF